MCGIVGKELSSKNRLINSVVVCLSCLDEIKTHTMFQRMLLTISKNSKNVIYFHFVKMRKNYRISFQMFDVFFKLPGPVCKHLHFKLIKCHQKLFYHQKL